MTATQTLTVTDNTPPALSGVPADATVQCGSIPAAATVTATDNCDPTVSVTFAETSTVVDGCGTITRTWTATDACGNTVTATQILTVVDNTPPVLSGVPADATVQCGSIPTAATVTATDNCDPTVPVTFNEIVSVTDGCGTITRTWTATDACGNTVTATQTLTVQDNIPPVLTGVPADATVQCGAIPAAATVTATDNCDPTVPVSMTETSAIVDGCGTITRTWTATDACGNTVTATQTLTVVDNTPPVLTGVPADATVQCGAIPAAATVTATDNCDPTVPVTMTETSIVADGCGTITRIWTSTDACGNTVTATQTLTVQDNAPPVLTGVPADATVQCGSIPTAATVTATDNCDPTVLVTFNEVNSVTDGCGTITRTWTATDACGNTVTATQTLTVQDNTPPVLTGVPADATVQCGAIPTAATVTATDNCDPTVPVTMTETSAVTDDCGTITRTWTATDACGNTATATQTLTVVDNIPPVLIGVPANATVQCGSIPATATVTATDNCDPTVTVTMTETSTVVDGCGTITRTWTATDACGNMVTATQTLTVVDNTPPVLSGVPADATVQCGSIPAIATVTAADNCDPTVPVTMTETNTVVDGCGTITRTWTATDACGNTATATQTLTVGDNTPPVLYGVPADATVQCDAIPTAATVTATDNCDPTVPVTFGETSTVADGCGTITRIWTATDACGNTVTATQTLTVVDNTPPVLSGVPADVTVQCGSIPTTATVTATDNCAPTVPVTFAETTTVVDGCGTITRTWTATDVCGNTVTATQTLTVVDNTPPVLTGVPVDATIQCGNIPAAVTVTATDNCDPTVPVTMTETNAVTDGCGTITRTWTATDACGNTVTATQTLTVVDNTPPVLTGVPADAAVQCGAIPVAATVTATDNCDPTAAVTFNETTTVVDGCGTITRTWTATDACGNTVTATQTLTVVDNTPPVLSGVPADATIQCGSIPAAATVTATDNCDPSVPVTYNETSTVVDGCGTIIRTWTATDACGNITTAIQALTVTDNTPPVLTCPPVQTFCKVPGNNYNIPILVASDNCSGSVVITFDITGATTGNGSGNNASGTFNEGTTIIIWTATDKCGNTSTCTTSVTVNPIVTTAINATICSNQLPYTWNGNNYNAAGTYKDTLTSAAGCDSIITLTLNVNPAVTGTQAVTICSNQLPYTWNGNSYNSAGIYKDTLANAAGCDSVVTLTLNVTPVVTGAQTVTVCSNQIPYIWNGNSYNSAGTYKDTLTSATGCDSIVTLTLNVNPVVTGSQTTTICDNQIPYIWNGNSYNSAGTYNDTLTSTTGCDSIVTLTLNVNPTITGSQSTTICANQLPYTWNGNNYNIAGTYTDTLINAAGCDSIVTLILNVNPVVTDAQTVTICSNHLPYIWNGNSYNTVGTYKDTLISSTGCDSIVTLTLNVNPVVISTQTATICSNQLPYTWNGNSYNATGTYKDTLTSAAGCDSIVTLTLNVNPTVTGSQTVTLCANQLPYSWNGNSYNAAGTYNDTLTSATGCDSIVTLTLNVNPVLTSAQAVTICSNQLPYSWNGNIYNATGTYTDTLTSAAGCDSVVTLTLNVNPTLTGSETITICNTQLPYIWNGNSYNAAGTYKDTLTSTAGCDSVVILTLNVNPTVTGSQTITVCASQLPYTWNGNSYNVAGTYKDTLASASGCDSIVTLILNVNPTLTGSETITICNNQLPYTWNSNSYNAAGTYKDTLTSAAGCDSIVILTLNVNPTLTGSETITICNNQLPYIWNGNSFNAAGTYKDTLMSAAGCDSAVTLILNINPTVTGTQTVTICSNQLPYTWNSNIYNAAGTYTDTLISAAGCDSIVTLILNVNLAVTGVQAVTICSNQLPYTWNGNSYNAAGAYKDTLISAAGCDSIVTLTLNVSPTLAGTETITICNNQLPYTWNGNSYNAAGTYKDTLTSAAGCDSIVILTLNVNPTATGVQTVTVCSNQLPYNWNGNSYNIAGTFKDTLVSAAGCDSVVTLTLNVNPTLTGSQTATICSNQLPYIWNGNSYNVAGTYKDTLISAAGCDSVTTLTLNVNPALTGSEIVTICSNQLPYTWNGNSYNSAGTYTDTLTSSAGCDSVVTLTLNVNSVVTGSQTVTICANQLPYTWNGNGYNAAGIYQDTLISAAGCDSVVTLILNINPTLTSTEAITICNNQLPYTWNSNIYNAAGTYKDTLTSAAGCDSIVTLTLNVNPALSGTESIAICNNQLPYTWNGNSYNEAGTYTDTLASTAGCDSIVTLTLNVNPTLTGSETITICNNQLPYTWNGNSYNAAGTYKDTLTSASGCDSVVTLMLNVNAVVTGAQTIAICANQLPYTWNGNSYNAAGSYKDTLTNAAGCDSIVTMTLNVNPVLTGSETITICNNQLPYTWNGNSYNAAGTYTDTLISAVGCDSVVTLTLNVNPTLTGTNTITICNNQLPYTWNGNIYNAAGTYADTLASAASCDSIVTLTLNVNPVLTGAETVTICNNQLPYTWNGSNYSAAGTYKDTLTSSSGCDSVVTLTLNVNPILTGSQTATICFNQLPYTWNGNSYNAAGTYTDTLTSTAGCDSIVTLTLSVNPTVTGTQTATICTNQLPYTWNGNSYNAAGTYTDTLTNAVGCDSVVTLTLNVNPILTGTETITICSNQLPYIWNGNSHNAAGTYKDTLTSAAGCDSVVTLTLNVNPTLTGAQTVTICSNQLPYTWNSNSYNAAGTYKDTLTSAAGCDSIVTLTLNVNPTLAGTETITICNNQLPYIWNGNSYNAAGTYNDTLTSATGCDSVVTLTLNVNPGVTSTQAVTICNNQLPYTWNSNIYNAAGTYKDTLTSTVGCDSIVTLILNVNPVVTGAQTATICTNQLPYTWNGNNYNAAGTYQDTLTSTAGCDSVVTLTLNVNQTLTGSETITICNNQLPYTWNGNNYNTSGTYKDTLTSSAGCDSIVTLTLNVNPALTGSETITLCNNQLPYTWNGTSYNVAGTYKDTLTSEAGCDSVVTLTLNANPVVTGAQTVTICANQLPYSWNGNSFNAAGTYKDTLLNAAGCDSVVTLTLNVNPAVTGSQTVTICSNQLPHTWNGNSYNAAGTYKDTLISAAGCDSVVTLTLNVNTTLTGSETITICNNQLPYTWNSNIYNAAGTYTDTLISTTSCDSIVTLTLNVYLALTGSETITICNNQLPYTWNGNSYNTAGTYTYTLISVAGCDSAVTLTLNVNPTLTGLQAVTICSNQLPYSWNGNQYNVAGIYADTLTSSTGCDSVVTLTLNVSPTLTSSETITICSNQLPYNWNSNIYNVAGTYTDTLTNAAGCDSIVTLTLNVNTTATGSQTVTICNNQLPYIWNGNSYNTAGIYTDTLISATGCDSVVTLTLNVNPTVTYSQTVTICSNQLPYTWNGNSYNAAGTYKDTLISITGCDSIVTLTLNVNPALTGTETITICDNQLPYTWNGNSYNAAGTYKDTLISTSGCDSVVTLILNVNQTLTGLQEVTICYNQLPYSWNGNQYNVAGTYADTLTNSTGCDSIVTLTLVVNPVVTGAQTVTICSNQLPYTWNGNNYNTAGIYKDTLTSAAGCDSIVTLSLNVNPTLTGSETITICNNQLPHSWNGNSYITAGTYTDTLISVAGCDSIVTLILNVNPILTGTETITICNNQLPYTWNGNQFTAAGIYADTLTSDAGCDSIVTLTLNVNPTVTGSQTVTICNNQLPYTWNGNSYNTAGFYTDTLISATGCDSIVTLTLNVNPILTGSETITICNNQLPYTWNGNSYNAAGTYTDTLISAAGCDSVVTLILNENPTLTGTETITICNNQLPYIWNGNTYNATGTYTDTLISATGCDSIVTLTLNVNSILSSTEAITICNNQLPYAWNGNSYNTAGTYTDTLTSISGCDSIVTLTLNVNPILIGAETVTICNNQLPYNWNGNQYNAAGTYTDTLTSTAGCDSVVTLTLNVNSIATGTETITICNSQLPYTWHGDSYNTAGTYKDTLVSTFGCDSIVTLTLNVNPTFTSSETITICNNQLPYTWNGNSYSAAGTYTDTLTSTTGCDSIIILTLNVNPTFTSSETITICNNQLPYTWNGNPFIAAGIYADTLTSAAGCDSVVTLTLNVNPTVTGAQTITICSNQLPYNWNGNQYNAAGTYTDTLISAAGCDSIAMLTLNVNPILTGTETITICTNQLPYTWNGNSYNAAGTYKDTLISTAGCDSIATLTLNVSPTLTDSETITICNNQLPYTWNGNSYNAAGTYTDTLTSASGCDSVVTLSLNVNPVVTGAQIVTICNNQLPYTWNGNQYNVAGTYADTLINIAGCDSIVTLTLNVNSTVAGSQIITICNNQLPYVWNGNQYNAAGTYIDTLTSSAGCDSVVTLVLNVSPTITGIETITICSNLLPYTWNGNTYNAAGTYTDTLISVAGCDSIVTLTLNVNPVLTGSETITICNNQLPYTWNGNSYNAAGTYTDTLISAAGCDSVVTLILNENPTLTGTETITICNNQLPYIWNGNSYNAAGTYTDTLTSSAGCDSIVTLTLNVNPTLTGSETIIICNNQLPYTWNSNIYSAAGTYTDTLTSASGCDSIITLTLNVNPTLTGSETITICNNQLPFTWNGNQYNTGGLYTDTLISTAGCDSAVILTLNVNLIVTGTEAITICNNELPYTWNGNSYNAAGTYTDTLLSVSGCDSAVTLTLNVNPILTGTETITICNNQLPYTWNGSSYNTAGTYTDTLTSAAGCDSVVTLTLNINSIITGTQTITICNNQLPYIWNGNQYNTAGTYTDTLISIAGCDSMVTLTLNVNPTLAGTETITICNNQLPYTWNDSQYNSAGTYIDTLISATGCDSIVILTLTVSPVVTGTQTATICSNQLPYTWNGNQYTAAGVYTDTLTSAAGCDSVITLTLSVNSIVTGTETITICSNQLPYTWNGNQYNAAGTYTDTLSSAAGCDSVVTLTLNVNLTQAGTETITICNNQLPYTWNGNQYNTAGTYTDTLTSAAGCDSVVTLTLNITPILTSAQTVTVCPNQFPFTWNDNSYNSAGTYTDTLTSVAGCDSVITLTLNVNKILTSTENITICNNQLPYAWNGNQYNAAGTYTDTLISTTGCDSVVTLTLNVSPALTGTEIITVCNNQLPYTWGGNSYNAAGTYTDTLTSVTGCDSVITLILNVNPILNGSETIAICNNQLPYTWNGNQYNAAGTYTDTLISAAGCDSVVTLILNINSIVTGTETITICNNQLPYTWNGNSYNAAGTYTDTLTNATGCDSVITLTLNVNPILTGTETITICNNQLPYTWNGNVYNAAGTYIDTLTSAAGCDSTVTLTLNVNPILTGAETITICNNQLPYTWNGNTYNAAGTYIDTLISGAGCDSVVALTLSINSIVTGTEIITICNNQLPYTWNGNQYNAAGTYMDTLTSTSGCDSVVTLTLNVNSILTGAETITICNNQLPYTWNGNSYSTAGTYTDTLISAAGCDSVVMLTLDVNPTLTGTETISICNNQLPYTWNGNTYTAAGAYTDTLISVSGCDSVVTLILNVNPIFTGTEVVKICSNQLPYTWNANQYNAAGTYTDTLTSATGCDSVVTLSLNVNPTLAGSETISICNNQLPYSWNGNSYVTAGTYTDTLISIAGCDSVVTLILNVNPILTGTETITICNNQLPYTWNGNQFTAAGIYADTLTSAAGCDSIVTFTLNVNPILTGTEVVTICTNQLPYSWNGNAYNTAGIYIDTLVSAAGCDSVVTLALNVNPTITGTETITICNNLLPYTWNGNTYNTAGTYADTLTSTTGCDSVVTLTLNVSPTLTSTETITICNNQLPYSWNGNSYNVEGTYIDTLTSAAGCDSIVTLSLNVNPTLVGTETITICNNQLPYTWNGNNYTTAGTYNDTLTSAVGCDSVVTLILNVSPVLTGTETITICNNQLPYSWNGNSYDAAGTYMDTLISIAGCDSVVTLTLNVNSIVTGTETISICNNQFPYTWNGNQYNAAGTYTDTLASSVGCDSVVTLTLNVNPILTSTEVIAICNNQLPYTWNGNQYNAAGTYTDTLISAAGCDSVVTLILNINSIVTGTETITICNNQLPYTWNGNTYNAAGTYTDTLISAAGCDSVVTLSLNVNPTLTGSETIAICNNQLPYTWNGNVYNTAGTYTDTLISAAGCDSVATLILNVNPILTGVETITICNNQLPYTWNGNQFTAAGIYADTLTSAAGCDSVVTLTLNVNAILTGSETIAICNNQLPYTWNGNTYNAAGTYSDTLISAAGCDSVVTLILNINSIVTGTETITICNNQLPYTWNGNTYNTAGTYTDTLTTSAGCDSIATLTLHVNPTLAGTETITTCANQLPYTWNGNQYNAAGTYTDTLTSAAGCDSLVTLILHINSSYTKTENISTCASSYILPSGAIATASGVYTSVFTNTIGCDSTIITNLTLQGSPTLMVTNPASVCGQGTVDLTAPAISAGSDTGLIYSYWSNAAATSLMPNPNAITTSGTYYIKATNAAGCYTIKPVVVQIIPLPTAIIAGGNICAGSKTILNITLTGKAPFTITYNDGTSNRTIPAITGTIYRLEVSPTTNTTYTITSVSDANCTNNAVSTAAVVNVTPAIASIRYPDVTTTVNVPTPLKARVLGSNYSYRWAPSIGLSRTNIYNPVYKYSQRIEYLIYITSDAGCIIVDTLVVKVISQPRIDEPPNLWVPNAWTPNKDGHNDFLFPFTLNIVELKYFRVFNRWGQLMFETQELGKGWDGIFKGVPQVMDTYTWTVEAIGNDGTVFKRAGNAMLLR
ncbi:HYR-like domain-containing protein [Paraflavitalea devenefica]|uniref:HYR-like domain-containing protein n=1 Tax=Paraflavitalea devenefica TaxID=2716334 RepID=UPI001ABB54DC|nr:gliding motility-associated C-terminal domain-containing protein [Paraflavitalea devenefica]